MNNSANSKYFKLHIISTAHQIVNKIAFNVYFIKNLKLFHGMPFFNLALHHTATTNHNNSTILNLNKEKVGSKACQDIALPFCNILVNIFNLNVSCNVSANNILLPKCSANAK